MSSFELERFVSRHLRALPMPRAPQTLLPRVMAAARAWSARPWYAREWFTWPLGWQIGSVALLLLVLGGGIAAATTVQALAGSLVSWLTPATQKLNVPQLASALEVTMSTGRVMWRALVQPLLPYAFVVVVLMSAACAALAVALNRMMFGRAFQS